MRHIIGYAATGTALVALTLAGCGSGGSGGGGATKAGTSTASGTTLTAADVKNVGTVVTDSKGFVLYRFDADSANPTKVTCYAACATLWPAATAQGAITTKGIDKNLVSTVKRTDGTTQLTLAGWPLYRYSKDEEPKEAYGQGVDGTWFAATPTGAKASGEPATNTGGSGY